MLLEERELLGSCSRSRRPLVLSPSVTCSVSRDVSREPKTETCPCSLKWAESQCCRRHCLDRPLLLSLCGRSCGRVWLCTAILSHILLFSSSSFVLILVHLPLPSFCISFSSSPSSPSSSSSSSSSASSSSSSSSFCSFNHHHLLVSFSFVVFFSFVLLFASSIF